MRKTRTLKISQIAGLLQQRVSLADRNENLFPHLLVLGGDNVGMIQWLLEFLNHQIHGSVITKTDLVAVTGMLKFKDSPLRSADKLLSMHSHSSHRREVADSLPDRPIRTVRAFHDLPGGGRYRPRDSYPHYSSRGDYDSYRPPYENSLSMARESISTPLHRRGLYQKRSQPDYRSGNPSISSRAVHRLPARPNFFSRDRDVYTNYRTDDDRSRSRSRSRSGTRTRSPISRASSRSSIASSVPSEKACTSSRSVLPRTPEHETLVQGKVESDYTTVEAAQRIATRLSPSYPSGPDSVQSLYISETDIMPPIRAQTITNDIMEADEISPQSRFVD